MDDARGGVGDDAGIGTEGGRSARQYRVLARKYRPATFAGLIGQDAMVRTLTNALRSGRLAHAYMLAGVRGVGKTTTARIIARALNCVGADGRGRPTPEPCGVCEHCLAIAQDRHLDVIEMDAASRTRVEEIRELLDGVPYRPTSARYKVYIVDEVHMLSTHSFNALLKTLEEPPEHVKFVFATTEIRKVPVTVLSRCQRFDLRRIEADVIARHLRTIVEREGIAAGDDALQMLARAADGSLRDGLSLLDQAIALGEGRLDTAVVREMLGLVDRSVTFDVLEAVIAGDAGTALALLAGQYQAGADPVALIEDLLALVHWLTRIKVAPDSAQTPGIPEAERVRGPVLAERLPMAHATRAWQMLLKGLTEARTAPVPIQAAEMLLIRLCYAAGLPTPGEALARLSAGADASPAAAPAALAAPPATRPPVAIAAAAVSPAAGHAAPDVRARRLADAPAETSPGVAAAPPHDLRTFADVVDLVRDAKEAILHGHLLADARLVRFAPGRIELNLTPAAPADLPQRLSRILNAHTGARWLVTVSREAGAPSLYDQARAAEAQRRAAIEAHPLVQEILRVFPGATIEDVRIAAPPDASPDEPVDDTRDEPPGDMGGEMGDGCDDERE